MEEYISDMKKFYDERNFFRYINSLKEVKDKYCIIIATSNMAPNTRFTKEMADILQEGLETTKNIYRCVHNPYIFVCCRNGVFEKIETEKSSVLTVNVKVEKSSLNISSYGFGNENKDAVINIFGENRAVKTENGGLHIMILDPEGRRVIDSCKFSFGVDKVECTHIMDDFLNYQKQHPGVSLFFFSRPEMTKMGNGFSEGEKYIIENNINAVNLLQQSSETWPEKFVLFKDYDTVEQIKEVLQPRDSYYDYYGVRKFEDVESPDVNIYAGIRATSGQPEQYERAIYIIGGCIVYGFGASDNQTISSWLQHKLNIENHEKIAVFNYGFFFSGSGLSLKEESDILYSLPVKKGDIVIVLPAGNYLTGLPLCDLSQISKRPHDYGEIYIDVLSHYTGAGNRMVADGLYEYLRVNDYLSFEAKAKDVGRNNTNYLTQLTSMDNEYLVGYKSILQEFYNDMLKDKKTVGSVVMNCNPFTKGHRFLIEQALDRCDYLIIFVVQEDKSVFSFDDRFTMVERGVSDLNNVVVIPSGQFIISSKTFSEYFNKDRLQERSIDTSFDLTIFANEIAPCLNISIRFVGEEPFDNVTKQYNKTMKHILPRYGIDVIEIPRKYTDSGESVISASKVRELLKNEEYEKILEYVPDTTLQYLMSNNESEWKTI